MDSLQTKLLKKFTDKVYKQHQKEFIEWLVDNPFCTEYQALHKANQIFSSCLFRGLND